MVELNELFFRYGLVKFCLWIRQWCIFDMVSRYVSSVPVKPEGLCLLPPPHQSHYRMLPPQSKSKCTWSSTPPLRLYLNILICTSCVHPTIPHIKLSIETLEVRLVKLYVCTLSKYEITILTSLTPCISRRFKMPNYWICIRFVFWSLLIWP